MVDLPPNRASLSESPVHQCLFGYDGGHKLLAASLSLPAPVTRALVLASDSPVGVETPLGSGDLIGFPVEEIGAYAFSTSWHAFEMPRPGCVWTHTLLVPFVLLARIPNLDILLWKFRRPQGGGNLAEYSAVLTIDDGDEGHGTRSSGLAVERQLLARLYGNPDRCVTLVAGADPVSFDVTVATVMAIWSQQWPRLRRSFRFRVRGKLEGIDENASSRFDLEAVREPLSDVLARSGAVQAYDRLPASGAGVRVKESPEAAWIDVANEDLGRRGQTAFRSFMRRYGADVIGGRAAFAGLASAFSARLQPRIAANSTVAGEVIARHFPDPQDAVSLKRAYLSGTLTMEPPQAASMIADLLDVDSLTSNFIACFETSLLDGFLDRELKRISVDDVWHLARKVSSRGDLPWRGPILHAAGQMTPPEEVADRAKGDWASFLAVVDASPNLKMEPATWIGSWVRNALIDAAGADEIPVQDLLRLLVQVEDEELARTTMDRFEVATIDALLQPATDDRKPAPAWVTEARRRPAAVLDRVTVAKVVDIALLEGIVSQWGIDDHRIRSIGNAGWATALDNAVGELPSRSRQRLALLMLTMAVSNPGPGSESLVSRFFDEVHASAANGLDDQIWRLVDWHLPGYWGRRSWDRCYRLKLAVCRAYLSGGMIPWTFLSVTSRLDLLLDLVTILHEHFGADHFLRSVEDQLPNPRTAKMQQRVSELRSWSR